jgi:tetratricopeptide (TPR) repeat protein
LTGRPNPTDLDGIAKIIQAVGLYVGVPVGALWFLYHPPKWFTSLRKAKGKVGFVEGELERDSVALAAPTVPPVAPTAAEPPPAVATDVSDVQVEVEEERSSSGGWFEKITAGQHDEGIELARREAAANPDLAQATAVVAFALAFSFRSGSTKALDELKATVEQNPSFIGVRLWYARALSWGNRPEQAIREAKGALDAARISTDRADAAGTLARFLIDGKRYDEAIATALEASKSADTNTDRGSLFSVLARAYEGAGQQYNAFLFYEAALREDPNDPKFRFDVAYKYGDKGASAFALAHYRRLLAANPTDDTYLNNAGVAAERLKLPIRAADYYGKAGDAGSTLAMSNLASKYLEAGFIEAAREQLDRAQEETAVNDRVYTTLAALAESQSSEDTKLKELRDHAGALTTWRLREVDALLGVVPPWSTLQGVYAGTPSGLLISVNVSGEVAGTLQRDYSEEAKITGTIEGSIVRFSWGQERTGLLASFLGPSKGEGIAFFSDDALEGYLCEGSLPLDAIVPKGWMEFRLCKQSAVVPAQASLGPVAVKSLAAPSGAIPPG